MMEQELGVSTRCWLQELELAVTWTGTIAVSRTDWIHKGGGCDPGLRRKMETLRKCYRDQFKELPGGTGLGPVPLLSLKKPLPSWSWCLRLVPQVTWGSRPELLRDT